MTHGAGGTLIANEGMTMAYEGRWMGRVAWRRIWRWREGSVEEGEDGEEANEKVEEAEMRDNIVIYVGG